MLRHAKPSRRHLLQAGVAATAAFALSPLARAADEAAPSGDITAKLARYMVAARDTPLPPEIVLACKQRILDSFAAMISGTTLRPGKLAIKYVQGLGGVPEASVVGARYKTSEVNAALANAMCAHADETDDFDLISNAHPGSSSVPAALAVGEKEGRSGEDFLRAVALGYDIGCRVLLALGPLVVKANHHSGPNIAANFSALGAAASLARLDEKHTRYAISYAAQQVAGLLTWVRDPDHIEKAFDFAGAGVQSAVQAVRMVQAGMTGVSDVLDGKDNLFLALSPKSNPAEMIKDLGRHFYVTETAIKRFSVGYPIQSPLDAFLNLRQEMHLTPDNVKSIAVKIPPDAYAIVAESTMPDVNCAHILSVALIKGTISFADSDDFKLMSDPAVLKQRAKVTITSDLSLADPVATRSALVEVTTTDGKTGSHLTKFPPGTRQNPLSAKALDDKVRDLMGPVLGKQRTAQLIDRINNLEKVKDIRQLRPLITG